MPVAPRLAFYFAAGSSSLAPHIALHEIGAPFESRPISIAAGGTRTPEFLALNAEGKVPVLVVDGRPMTEVAGILFYLARQYPEAKLLPQTDAEAEARIVSWMSFIAATVHPVRRQGPDAALRVWSIADERLKARDWAVGNYSIADIHLFRLFWRYVTALNGDLAAFPNLAAHYKRMMARPAVRKALEIETALGIEMPGQAPKA
jgi:glutathione S-transferase